MPASLVVPSDTRSPSKVETATGTPGIIRGPYALGGSNAPSSQTNTDRDVDWALAMQVASKARTKTTVTDKAVLDTARDINEEEIWGIMNEREAARRTSEFSKLGSLQALRYLERQKMHVEETEDTQ